MENIFPQTQTTDCLSDESHCTGSDKWQEGDPSMAVPPAE